MTTCFTLESKYPRTSMQRDYQDWTLKEPPIVYHPQIKQQTWQEAWMNSSPEFDDIFGRMTKDLSLTNFTCGKTQVPKKFGGKIPEIKYTVATTQRIEFCGRQHHPKFAPLFPRINIKGRPREISSGALPGFGPLPFSVSTGTSIAFQ